MNIFIFITLFVRKLILKIKKQIIYLHIVTLQRLFDFVSCEYATEFISVIIKMRMKRCLLLRGKKCRDCYIFIFHINVETDKFIIAKI